MRLLDDKIEAMLEKVQKAPRYTGRKLAVASPGDAVPQVGDRVTLLLGSHCAGVLLDDTLLNTWGMSPGKRDGSYSYADVCRRNVVEPRKEGETFLEAAFVGPMLSRSALSPEQAEALSAFAVRGTIKNAKLIQGPLYADYMQQPSWEDPLETWDGEIWRVYVSIDEALKQDGEPLEAGDELVLYVPKTLTNAASGKELTFDGVAPAEGAEITVRWNEGGAEPVAVDFTARTADGAIDVLFGFVDRDPPGPDGLIRID